MKKVTALVVTTFLNTYGSWLSNIQHNSAFLPVVWASIIDFVIAEKTDFSEDFIEKYKKGFSAAEISRATGYKFKRCWKLIATSLKRIVFGLCNQ